MGNHRPPFRVPAGHGWPMARPNGTGGTLINGTLVGASSGRVPNQGITFTINRAF